MSDLISRQAAIDALADYIHNVDKVMGTGKLSAHDCKDAARSVLDYLPPAQPEPKRGRWIEDAEAYYKAVNEKGGGVNGDTPFFTNEVERFDFCPNCGAEIRGEQDE